MKRSSYCKIKKLYRRKILGANDVRPLKTDVMYPFTGVFEDFIYNFKMHYADSFTPKTTAL
jgi:hypothetical protein